MPATPQPDANPPEADATPPNAVPSEPDATPSEPDATHPPTDPAPPPAETNPLLDYVRANRGAYTEEALRRAALSAGNAPVDVEAALAATRQSGVPAADRGRAVRNVFLWYVGVFLALSVLIAINQANTAGGFLGDTRAIGILILAMSLGVAFVASLVWIASRRVFWTVLAVIVLLNGLGVVTSNSGLGVISGAVFIGFAILVLAGVARVGVRPGMPARPSMELLMIVPMLMLLAVGGICVASGLPIPRGS